MTVNWHDGNRPIASNDWSHADFKGAMFKQWFWGYYFLGKSFWRADQKDFESYVVKVKCSVKGVYATPGFNEYCLKIKDGNRIGSYGMIANSKDVFKTEIECKAMYEDYFKKEYEKSIIEDYKQQIKYKKDHIQRSKASLSTLEKGLSKFQKEIA